MVKNTEAAVDIFALNTTAACDKGAEIELKHPKVGPSGVFVTVMGKDSVAYRDHVKSNINERQRREALAARRGKDIDNPTLDEAEEKGTELIIVCTLGWRQKNKDGSFKNTLTYKGEELDFNVSNAKLIYTNELWIRREVDDAIHDLENFM